MEKLHTLNELGFSLLWIAAYIFLYSAADALSAEIGVLKIVTLPVAVFLTLVMLAYIRGRNLWSYYGLAQPKDVSPRVLLYYIPFIVLASANLWNGIALRSSALEILLFVATMACVGFMEEVLFRGLLFRALAKRRLRTAILVSSLTFGLGHIVNLFNGAAILPTLLQILYATSIGYLFTVFFVKTQSLIPCMITHATINALSLFAVEGGPARQILFAILLTILSLAYARYLSVALKTANAWDGE
jgi:membrane protease YdiL (CAAX protease family)